MPLHYKMVKVAQKEISGFTCDRCKAEYSKEDDVGLFEMDEMVRLCYRGGYASVWGDGTLVDIVICQRCGHELFKDFATTIPLRS